MSGSDKSFKSWGQFHWLQLKHSRCFAEWMSDWMDENPCSRCQGLWDYLDAQAVYVPRTDWSRFLGSAGEWPDGCTHITRVNVRLSQKQARSPTKTVPCGGFRSSSAGPFGHPVCRPFGLIIVLWDQHGGPPVYCPTAAAKTGVSRGGGRLRNSGTVTSSRIFSFQRGEREAEKLGIWVSKPAKDINQQNCVAASINV